MRRRHSREEENPLFDLIATIFGLYALYLLLLWFTDKTDFVLWVIYGIVAAAVVSGVLIGFQRFKKKRKENYLSSLLVRVREKGQEDYIDNFINRFGHDGKKGNSFMVRDYSFAWERVNDLEKVLQEKGIELRHNGKQKDIYVLLRYYIQEKEESITRESIKNEPRKFAILSKDGSEFEKLLYRLFSAMGYKAQVIGRSGDQGGDLIANKNGERILIQAKCYRDWSTGNAAVQQVVAALKYYDCNKAMVVTTSHFTAEAMALAKANNTELISKERLQELLLQHLKESWY